MIRKILTEILLRFHSNRLGFHIISHVSFIHFVRVFHSLFEYNHFEFKLKLSFYVISFSVSILFDIRISKRKLFSNLVKLILNIVEQNRSDRIL